MSRIGPPPGSSVPAEQKNGAPDPESPTRVYHSEHISVEWYAHRCIHSGRCVRALPRVFNPQRRPWIDVEAADSEDVARAVLGCPSGALRLVRHVPKPLPAPDDRNPQVSSLP